jgi:hypothetical protein
VEASVCQTPWKSTPLLSATNEGILGEHFVEQGSDWVLH